MLETPRCGVPLLAKHTLTQPCCSSIIGFADQGVGYTDDSFNGRNYNNGGGALGVATVMASVFPPAAHLSKSLTTMG